MNARKGKKEHRKLLTVGLDDLQHHGLELEKDVGNVENGQEPFVAVAVQVEIIIHASDTSVPSRGTNQ